MRFGMPSGSWALPVIRLSSREEQRLQEEPRQRGAACRARLSIHGHGMLSNGAFTRLGKACGPLMADSLEQQQGDSALSWCKLPQLELQ